MKSVIPQAIRRRSRTLDPPASGGQILPGAAPGAEESDSDPTTREPKPLPARVEELLGREIEVSRRLLRSQEKVWDALRLAHPAATVEQLLVEQEEILDEARVASQARQALLPGTDEFALWLDSLPSDLRFRFQGMREEARALRAAIEDLAERSNWLASRSAYWIDAQRSMIGELAARSLGPGTYASGQAPTRRETASTPSLLDRSA